MTLSWLGIDIQLMNNDDKDYDWCWSEKQHYSDANCIISPVYERSDGPELPRDEYKSSGSVKEMQYVHPSDVRLLRTEFHKQIPTESGQRFYVAYCSPNPISFLHLVKELTVGTHTLQVTQTFQMPLIAYSLTKCQKEMELLSVLHRRLWIQN